MRLVIATAAVLATLALAACGSSSAPAGPGAKSRTVSSSTSRRIFSFPGGSAATPVSGRALFHTNCSGCHSLTGHQSPRKQGGDLVAARLPRPVALQYAREMPVRRALTRAQLAAIVDYIAAVQRH